MSRIPFSAHSQDYKRKDGLNAMSLLNALIQIPLSLDGMTDASTHPVCQIKRKSIRKEGERERAPVARQSAPPLSLKGFLLGLKYAGYF